VPAAVRWTGLALLGIVIAAAVSVAASRLASQQIGLASEPISAGDALAPAHQKPSPKPARSHGSKGHGKPKHRNPPSSAATQPATPVAPALNPPAEELEPSHTGEGEDGGGGADD
jgi:hypothetical protein